MFSKKSFKIIRAERERERERCYISSLHQRKQFRPASKQIFASRNDDTWISADCQTRRDLKGSNIRARLCPGMQYGGNGRANISVTSFRRFA